MKLDELKDLWNTEEMTPDKELEIRQQLLRESGVHKISSIIAHLRWGSIFELCINIVFLWILVPFMQEHGHEMHYLLSAALLFAISLGSVVFQVIKLHLHYSLHADDAVLGTQMKLERLRIYERWDKLSLLVIIPLFAFPFMIVAFKYFLNVDILQHLPLSWIWFTMGSAVVALIITFILLRFPDQKLNQSIDFLKGLKEYKGQ